MESYFQHLRGHHPWARYAIGATVGIASLALFQYWTSISHKKRLRQLWDLREKDVVTLHMFHRATNCPNISPFVIKLETYLRMANIKYVPDFEQPMGSKNKCPWITVNGVDVPDSQLAIQYLSKKFGKDIEEGFTNEEKAISKAFRVLIEDHFHWASAMERWVYRQGRDFEHYWPPGMFGIPSWLPKTVINFIYKMTGEKMILPQCRAQGMGRHTKEEVMQIGKEALDDISCYLGDKDFLLGDRPCLADLSLFAYICLFVCLPQDSNLEFYVHIREKCPNLVSHQKRMALRYWPDYDKVVHGSNK